MYTAFGGRTSRATWWNPGVGQAQYETGQPVLNTAIQYARVPEKCNDVYTQHPHKYWLSHSPEICRDIYQDIKAPEGMQPFYEPCGCGVTLKSRPTEYMCNVKDRTAKCGNNYAPVCGIDRVNDHRISFVNKCSACVDPKINAYTSGGGC